MEFPDFSHERRESSLYRSILGIDEAGRGPIAGPVVAAVARYRGLYEDFSERGNKGDLRFVRDSKTISEKDREHAFETVYRCFDIGIGQADVGEIDQINILQATFLAMRRAIADFLDNFPFSESDGMLLLVDGNREIPNPGVRIQQQTLVRGDSKSFSIAAASIVAKVTRDRIMRDIDKTYPGFHFAKHKGYGTALHLEAIAQHGITPQHRLSFAPISKHLRQFAKQDKT